MPETNRIVFTLPEELRARLDAHHAKTGAPLAEIIRRALDAYLPKADGPSK